ncbi:MAG: DUF4347 domain-containing protein [Symploca sp. SIO1C2]|nr:DUF4347 domain-containing protein [Symploca sp. SIO1C2]
MNNFNSSTLSKLVSGEDNNDISVFYQKKPSFSTDKNAAMLVVIDPRVEAYQMLAEGVHQGANVLILDPSQDGIEQITQTLAGYPTSTSLHIVCHGAPGTLHLGDTFLNGANLEQYRQQLQTWEVAEIFFYACNLAAETIPRSQSFLSRFHQLTGAQIAASANKIGNALRGGCWYLEHQIGQIAGELAFESAVMQAYPGVLPIIVGPSNLITSEDGTATGTFGVVLSDVPTDPVLVLINGDASEGTPDQTFLLFDDTNWNIPQIVTVTGVDDAEVDGDITYNLNITPISGDPNFRNAEVIQVTNLDDDVLPNLSISDVTVDEAAGTATFDVTLSQASGEDVTVDFNTVAGTADDTTDFTGASGTLTIAAGATTGSITVNINDDTLNELTENFTVELSNATNATIADGQGVGTITDNDPLPNVSINDVTVNEGAGTATFTVSLDAASGQDVTVDFTTTDVTAINPDDYTGTNGTLTIAAGETTGTITVNIADDNLNELPEEFTVDLTGATNATILQGIGTGTITDNDQPPNVSVGDVTVDEAAGVANFTISLDVASGQDVTVDFATVAGTAISPDDFTDTTGTATIAAGQTSVIVSVPIINDTLNEADETFSVSLTNATNANLTEAQGVGTITDDDALPNLFIDDVTINEGGAATFTVSLSQASGQNVSVDFAAIAGTADDLSDFIATSSTLTIAAGDTTGTITINTIDDALNELPENFTVELSNATNATITDAQGIGTITDDDAAPNLSINDVMVNEGAGTATFTVSLDAASGQDVTVDFTTNDFTAINPDDYTGANGTLTIAAGDTTGTITVNIADDTLDEGDETFTVDLTNATNAAIADNQGAGTITDNDLAPALSIDDITVDEATGIATFTVSLDQASAQDVMVDFTTNAGTAITPDDFTDSPGTLTIAAGQTSATISVPITNDLLNEGDETFTVNLTNPVNATISDPQGIATITDDDALPNLSINDVTVNEGDGTATFTVSLDAVSGQNVTVDFATLAGTADDLSDFIATSSTLTIAAGDTTGTITVNLLDDALNEPIENFTVELSNATNANIADAQGIGIINDDDVAPELSIDDVTVNEGAGTATFTVTLDAASGQDVTVDFTTNDGSAINPDDFTGTNGTLTIAAGDTTGTITVNIADDALDEGDEDFTVELVSATNATIGADNEGTGTITDNDLPPNLSIDDVTVSEDGGTATFTVSLDQVSAEDVTVDFTTNDGSAVNPDDFTATTGTVTIAAGQTSATISVPIISDTLSETDETFTVDLSNAVNANILDPQGVGTITDNNQPPNLSIDDVAVDENAGTATFTVSLDRASGQDITVDFATLAGTALDTDDFTGTSGTLTILAGDTTGTITVNITDDTLNEPIEDFTVELSNATNATIADAQGLGTITDDDAAPNLSINDVTVNEGAGTATFTVSLDAASGQDVTVNFTTNDGIAINPDDYTGNNGALTIAAGDTTGTITVDIADDALDEGNETFTVDLVSATNATILDNQGIGTITDNDLPPVLSIDDVTVDEAAGVVNFTVSLDQVSAQDVTVDFATLAGTAVNPDDFTDTTGTLTITAGQTSATIAVPITNDLLNEGDETFSVNLTNAVNATIGDPQGVATITDDDTPPNLSIDDVTVDEAAGTATFTVSLDAATGQDVTVDFATVAGTALEIDDFSGTNGTVTILAGDTTGTITVDINNDILDEPNETFTVELSNATNANIADAQGLGTITDDDLAPGVSINDVTVNEGAGTATFVVSLDAASAQDVTIDFATNDGTAINPDDYTGGNGTLTIAAGDTTGTITVDIADDAIDELDETFTVDLISATNATITDDQGVGTITDNDLAPNLSIDDVMVSEDGGTATFTVTLDQASAQDVTVDFTTNNGSAVDPDDFTGTGGTLTITAGQTSATISVPIISDTLSEVDETFTVNLSNAVNANILDPQGVGTITDNNLPPNLSIDDVIVDEGAGTATFTVSLDRASGQDVTLDFATVAGTALDIDDFTGTSGTITILAGDTTGTITVNIVDDALDEPIENFTVELSNATNAIIADAQGLGTITDNDDAPNLSIDDVTVNEGAGTATFTVTLDAASAQDITVDFATADDTAINPDDYAGTNGTLTIAAGETSGTFTVDIADDALDEVDETFTVDLTNATNATIADAQGIGTITDNDLAPNVSIDDITVDEAAGFATFTISLDAASAQDVTVDFATAIGTAVNPDDFTDTTGTVTITAGQTSAIVSVPITNDLLNEVDETFSVNLTNAVNATIVDAQGVGTITDDDALPNLSIDDVTVDEAAGTATFTVSLDAASGQNVTVDFATLAGTAEDFIDFLSTNGTLTIAAGDTTGTITVNILDDALNEPIENFTVELSNATNANIADAQGLGTITDDDVAPEVSINDVTVNEGAGTATFVVSLNQASGQDITVDFTTNDGTAINPDDFTGTNGTVTIAAGDTAAMITVDIADDAIDELDENFTVDLTNATNATIADDQGTGTIIDNDLPPNVSINDVMVSEDGGAAIFTVSLDQVSAQDVTVDFATAAGTAINPDDFTDTTGTVTIAAGQTSATISIPIISDTIDEIDEMFTVNLSNAVNANITDPQGVGTITDNNVPPNLSIDNVTVDEAAGTATFTVSLDQTSGQNITVDFATVAGTATETADFTANNGTLTILAGETTGTITVDIIDDALDELNETFTVELSNATNANIVDAEGLGTITDDDAAPNLSINDLTVNEGAGTATFTVTLDAASGQDVTVNFTTNDDTAVNPDDFTGNNGTLTIAAGETTGTITVDIVDDAIDEVDETFTVDITSATNATITDNQGIGTITDNDLAPNVSIDDVTVDEAAGVATFTISLDGASGEDVTVDFATAVGTAIAPDDFTDTTGTVTIAAGQTSAIVSVAIANDTLNEADETFTVNLSNAVNATIVDPTGIGTITDDDAEPTLSIDNVTVDEAAGTATFTVSLNAASGQDVTVDFATLAGTALDTDDFTGNSGTLTILAGDTTGTITVDIIDDALNESNETFTVELSNATNATIADAQGLGTITDDDAAPNLSINDVTVNEGAGTATFTVTLDAASGQDVTVNFTTSDGTAVNPDDYTGTNGSVTIAAGQTTGTITVDIADDAIDEVDETFNVDITSATNATITDNQGVGTITDNDLPPNISINDVMVSEDAGTAIFTVSLDQASSQDVTVDFATTGGSAVDPDDFTGTTGTVTIAAGQTSATISIPIISDNLDEVDETFTVDLTNAVNGNILDPQGVGTITDNNLPPNLSIDNVTVDEAAGTATFTVSLDQTSGQDITVDFATVAGTADATSDFTGDSGTLTILAGATTGTITVDIIDDALDEQNETFTIELSNATNAVIADAQGIGTITDNDEAPNLSIDDVTVNEGAGTATFTVSLDAASGQDVTVNFATNDGTAINPDDYTGNSGTLTIAAGETTGTVTVNIADDAIDEVDETFTVDLSNATNATILDAQGVGTITDNDLPPNLSIGDVTVDEATGVANFTISLDQASSQDVTVDFATAIGTAVTPDDFTDTTGSVTIAAGQTSAIVSVAITNDTLNEADETFTVNLTNAVNATILDAQGVGTITDDDALPNLSIDDVTVDEAAGTATFTVSLDAASGQDVTVDFATVAGTAEDLNDFISTNSTLTIAAGATTATITVNIIDDTVDEALETFTVELSNATNATIADAQGMGTIIDNDAAPNLSINDVTFNEGAGTATFIVSLDAASGQDVTVDFITNDGTAINPDDYTGTNGTVTIAAGQTTGTITVDIADDAIDELDETFTVDLISATNATIADNQGIGTITDNDLPPNLSINDVTVDEAGGIATFTVTLDAASGQDVTVDFATAIGTAVTPDDFTDTTGTVTIAAGQTSAIISVPIINDLLIEGDETFTVNLSNAVNATITDPQGIGTIIDDEIPSNISIDDVTVDESAGTATFTVTLDRASGQDVTVDFTTNDGTAVAPDDFTANNGTLTIAAGQTTGTITVDIIDDAINETDETFTVDLTNATNAVIADAQGIGTITDNDGPPNLSIDDVTVDEGAGTATFTVTLDAATTQDVTVDFATTAGTAVAPDDFTATNGTLTIAAGQTTGTITVNIADDAIDELDETFTLDLSNATNAVIADAQGIGTITDNDAAPNISIDDVTVDETAGTATFTVSLDAASGQDVTVDFTTNDGTAVAPGDFTATNGTLTIAAGQTTGTITVDIIDDGIDEADETFTVDLSNATNATIADAQGVGTIAENTTPLSLNKTLDDVIFIEGNAGDDAQLLFTLDESNAFFTNEIGVFIIDDDQGTVNGVAPGSANYLETVLENGQVILSALGGNELTGTDTNRQLGFEAGDRLGFYLVQNDTTDNVLDDLAGGSTDTNVFFTFPSANSDNFDHLQLSMDDDTITLNWEDALNGGDQDFDDVVLTVQLTDAAPPLGTELQGDEQGELIDLRDELTGLIATDFVTAEDADFDNSFGFYAVDDASGSINGITPDNAIYAALAVSNRVDLTAGLPGGSLLAPFFIADGTADEFLISNASNQQGQLPQAYFSFLGANPDGRDHIARLGDNTFGFEDNTDFDYNDLIVQVDFT